MNSYADDRTDERFSDVDPGELHELKSKETLRRFQRHNRARQSRAKLLQVIIFFVMIAVFAAICITKVFVIGSVEVVGTDRYTGDELLALIGASKGDSLYSISSKNVAALPSKLSLVRSVTVSRKLPQTLIIRVNEDVPLYYCELYGEYFLLSDTLRVLDRVFDEESAKEAGLIRVELPAVDKAVVGTQIVFDDVSDFRYVSSYLSALESSSVRERVNAFDLRDKFDLEMICDSIYLVKLADGEELPTKLSTLSQVLTHDAMQGRGKSTIDVSNPAETRVDSDITGDVAFSHR